MDDRNDSWLGRVLTNLILLAILVVMVGVTWVVADKLNLMDTILAKVGLVRQEKTSQTQAPLAPLPSMLTPIPTRQVVDGYQPVGATPLPPVAPKPLVKLPGNINVYDPRKETTGIHLRIGEVHDLVEYDIIGAYRSFQYSMVTANDAFGPFNKNIETSAEVMCKAVSRSRFLPTDVGQGTIQYDIVIDAVGNLVVKRVYGTMVLAMPEVVFAYTKGGVAGRDNFWDCTTFPTSKSGVVRSGLFESAANATGILMVANQQEFDAHWLSREHSVAGGIITSAQEVVFKTEVAKLMNYLAGMTIDGKRANVSGVDISGLKPDWRKVSPANSCKDLKGCGY